MSVQVSTFPVTHFALPDRYVIHNLFSLSSGMGGLSLFNVNEGCKTLAIKETQALKTKYYPDNTNYLGVMTA
jgi:hypothetical protein